MRFLEPSTPHRDGRNVIIVSQNEATMVALGLYHRLPQSRSKKRYDTSPHLTRLK
jgi:hypothetical protein